MPDISLPNINLHYEISGDGPPLLLIAGMLSDSASWAPLLPFLEPHFTVIRPDNRATGRTTPLAPYSIPDNASDIAELLDHLALGPVHVMGHSLGGFIAMLLAQQAPGHLKSLTSLCSAPLNGPRNFLLFQNALYLRKTAPAGVWLAHLFPWLMSPSFFKDETALPAAIAASEAYPFAQSIEAMTLQIDALTRYTLPGEPAPLPCPAQAILGDNDLLFPEPAARAVLSKMFGPQNVHTIKNAAHSIHWEQPAQVAKVLKEFTLKPRP